MYSYFVTTSSSCSNIKSIKCRLVKDSTAEYLVCLKSHAIDVYSLWNNLNEPKGLAEDESKYPFLVTSLHSYFTFLTLIEYRPPSQTQSHLLVLTQNYTLVLLTFDSESCKFITKNVACLQEPFSEVRQGSAILKIDVNYNLVVFCGHSRIIKCIILNKCNYFNFSDIITMRTNDCFFLDVEFISAEYTGQKNLKSHAGTESSNFSTSLNQDLKFKSPNRNSSIHYFECKLILLGQDNGSSEHNEPVRWLYGMHLMFEIELLNGYKRFNSYSNVDLFGEPIKLNSPFSMFIPLSLNDSHYNKFDSVIILGAGSVGYATFKSPKHIKYFKLDYSITEVSCYLEYGCGQYLFADDNGNVYFMELLISNKSNGSGLKRRVSSSISSKSVHTTRMDGELTVQDVLVKRVGSCSIPSSIVKLDEERIFCASKIGNSYTIGLNLNKGKRGKVTNHRPWIQSNLGPVTDFIYLQETDDSNSSILACCGMGSSGTLSKIYFGIGSEVLYSTEIGGVSNLYSIQPRCESSKEIYFILCISFYRYTKFYIINNLSLDKVEKSANCSLIDLFEAKLSEIVKLEKNEFVYDETTLLFSKLENGYILQITPLNVLIANKSYKVMNRAHVSQLVNDGSSEFIVSSIICGKYILLLLSTNTIILLDHTLNVVNSKQISTSVSSVTYISKRDLGNSHFRDYPGFKEDGLVAVACWDNVIVIMCIGTFEILYTYSCNINFGTFIKSLKFTTLGSKVYMLASVSDGKLYTYKFAQVGTSGHSTNINMELDNIIEVSDKSFKLLDVNMNGNQDSCDLRNRKLITTGSKCNIIHANNNKIEYTRVNVNNLHSLVTLANRSYNNVNIGRNDASPSNAKEETLVVYYAKSNLVVGILDFVKNLNVKTILSGTNFNKIVYHHSSKLAIVSTIPQYIINPNTLNKMSDRGPTINGEEYSHSHIKKRKINTEKDKDQESINESLESNHDNKMGYYILPGGKEFLEGMEKQNLFICTDSNELLDEANDYFSLSCLLVVDVDNNKVLDKLEVPKGHIVSSLKNYNHSNVEYIAVGTSLVMDQDDLPIEGLLYLIEIGKTGDSFKIKVQKTKETFKGGVVDIATLNEMLVLAVNSTLMVLKLNLESNTAHPTQSDTAEIKSNKASDDGHNLIGLKNNSPDKNKFKFEYIRGSVEECNKYLEMISSYESNTYIVSIDVCNDTIFIGDLMTSVKLIKFKENCLYESCRDFNTLWTSSLAAIDEYTCLVSDDSGNFTIFSKAKNPVNDHKSIKFDTLGLFHHGETVNKILKRENNVTPKHNFKIATKLGRKLHNCTRLFCCSKVKNEHVDFKLRECSNIFSTIFTCCTSSGSFLQLCLFDDMKLFIKLSLLEQTLQSFHNEIGINFNKNYRNFENTHTTLEAKGFIDGDLTERFLKLPQALKEKIFDAYRKNSQEMDIEYNKLEEFVGDIENIYNSRLM